MSTSWLRPLATRDTTVPRPPSRLRRGRTVLVRGDVVLVGGLDRLDHPGTRLDHPGTRLDHPGRRLDHPGSRLDPGSRHPVARRRLGSAAAVVRGSGGRPSTVRPGGGRRDSSPANRDGVGSSSGAATSAVSVLSAGAGSGCTTTTSARPCASAAIPSARSAPWAETRVVIPIGTASATPYIFWFRAAARRPRTSSPSRARDRLCGANISRPSRNSPRRGCTTTRSTASQGRPRHWLPSRIRTPSSSATSSGVRASTRLAR